MGPLEGVKIVEFVGIGPGPFCAMMLADMGADVIRLDRSDNVPPAPTGSRDLTARNRRSLGVNLKSPEGVETALRLLEQADALVEGFRPGVMERLGVGPDVCLARNPRLVYGRMTGWGQDGPMANMAGHDINYIALSGVLHAIGRSGERPVPPLNLIGDFGGGGMLLAFGVVCGVLNARITGHGQVVDAAMVDGASVLATMIYGMVSSEYWNARERGVNALDGGLPYYDTYETRDGRYFSVGSLEPQFYAELLRLTGLTEDPATKDQRSDQTAMRARLTEVFKSKTRDEWQAIFDGTDACAAPVLNMIEAPSHPHNVARGTFVELDGIVQPAPAPRFSRTPPALTRLPESAGTSTDAVLADWGFATSEIEELRRAGAVK